MISGSQRFIIDEKTAKSIESRLLRRLAKNSDIERFALWPTTKSIIYTENIESIEDYPEAHNYLRQFYNELKPVDEDGNGRPTIKKESDWWKFSRPQNKELFDNVKEKIVVPYIAPTNKFALDDEEHYTSSPDIIAIAKNNERCKKLNCEVDLKYILAALNSSVLTYYHLSNAKRKDYRYEYFPKRLDELPIPKLDFSKKNDKKIHDEIVGKTTLLINASKKAFILQNEYELILEDNQHKEIAFEDLYRYALEYGIEKKMLLKEDIEVATTEIDLELDDNRIIIKAFIDEEWQSIISMKFEDEKIRDFLFLALREFLRTNETGKNWRRGYIIKDVIMGIRVPQFMKSSTEDARIMGNIIKELKKKVGETSLGSLEILIKENDKDINSGVYRLFELEPKDQQYIEDAIGYGIPYLRY